MPASAQHRVVFTPSGLSGQVDSGTSVLEAARRLGVDLDTVCGGRGICGRCQIVPGIGEFAKWAITATADHLSPPGELELEYRGKRPLRAGQRLGCAARIVGDVVVDVPPESHIHRQVVRKQVDVGDLVVDPMVTLHYVVLDLAEDGESVTERIAARLDQEWSIPHAGFDSSVLVQVHEAASADGLTVAVRDRAQVVGIWPGYVDRVAGVAVDVGSTTIAGHLCDLATGEVLASAGRMNPQIRFGEDLMSRVSYVMMNPGGDAELTAAVRAALDDLVGELCADAGLDLTQVLDLVLVDNPIMHHIALGIDPTPLGQAPFPLATRDAVHTLAADLGIDAPARVYVAPCIAGHVGADTAAAILSEGPHRGDAIQLLVDVGTNAEIVLGNRERLFAASSPTGPAFEGAQISSGQRATAGAIERVRVDRDTLEPRFKLIGSDVWSDEPGFAAATAATGVTGICGSGIIEVISELFLAGVIDAHGVISGGDRSARVVPAERTASYVLHDDPERPIHVTQADVRAIQLAKAALRAGIELLLEHAGLTAVDEIRLAGAFGAHIDPVHAMVLGLVPDCPVDRVRSVGNAAGSGAVRALLSAAQRREMESVVAGVTKIETATEPRFQELFVAALAFPHLTAPTPNLDQVVALPSRDAADAGRRRRSRKEVAS